MQNHLDVGIFGCWRELLQFANLRVWRDLNQDGVSQSDELFTLANLDIASLDYQATRSVNPTLPGDNMLDSAFDYTRTDGSKAATASYI